MDPQSGHQPRDRSATRALIGACLGACLAVLLAPPSAAASEREQDATERRSVAGVDLLRVGFPGGVGLGVRSFPIPELAFEAGATTFILATTFELAVATMPLRGGPDRKIQPVVRVGYRRMFIHEASDRAVRNALPYRLRALSEELALEGARLNSLFASMGFAYRFRRPALLEVSLGYMGQVGSTRARGGREAVQLSAARFAMAELRMTFLLPRTRRP